MAKSKSDPLLSALIAKLPPQGEEWPVDQQLAWLNLMALSFGAIYGGNAAARLGITGASLPGPALVPKRKPAHPFIIDKDGIAKRGNGERVMPTDVDDILVDIRGPDGDLGSIIWADGSKGSRSGLTIIAA